jgi:hypothetical protein
MNHRHTIGEREMRIFIQRWFAVYAPLIGVILYLLSLDPFLRANEPPIWEQPGSEWYEQIERRRQADIEYKGRNWLQSSVERLLQQAIESGEREARRPGDLAIEIDEANNVIALEFEWTDESWGPDGMRLHDLPEMLTLHSGIRHIEFWAAEQFYDGDIQAVANLLPDLESLSIMGETYPMNFTQAGLERIYEMRSLKSLRLHTVNITEFHLDGIQNLSELETLVILNASSFDRPIGQYRRGQNATAQRPEAVTGSGQLLELTNLKELRIGPPIAIDEIFLSKILELPRIHSVELNCYCPHRSGSYEPEPLGSLDTTDRSRLCESI